MTASSSNPTIVAPDAIMLTGSGSARTIEAASVGGCDWLGEHRRDGDGSAGAVEHRDLRGDGASRRAVGGGVGRHDFVIPEDGAQQTVRGITFVQDADDPAAFDPLLQ